MGDTRKPLKPGTVIRMKNGAEYVIRKKIADGGFSLIYDAQTEDGTGACVVKEYFPMGAAFRGEDGKVYPKAHCEAYFNEWLEHFVSEGEIGGAVSARCSHVLPMELCGGGYAIMKKNSSDMHSAEKLIHEWKYTPPVPYTGKEADRDPVFPDFVQVEYALRVTESLLSVLSEVHACGYLHLDISLSNVLWAGEDWLRSGRNCAAYLADFGCAVPLTGGRFEPKSRLPYSRYFASPEVLRTKVPHWNWLPLTPATDLYSVGILLYFLCMGQSGVDEAADGSLYGKPGRRIRRNIGHLKLPTEIQAELSGILCKAVAENMDDRYQSTGEMQQAVQALALSIPRHPINSDCTDSFTLCLLRSMLEGSRKTHYSWAHELRDRRGVEAVEIPSGACEPVTATKFADDRDFLVRLLPEEISRYLSEKISASPDSQRTLLQIMTGNYDWAWKHEISRRLQQYGTRELLKRCRTLLDKQNVFEGSRNLLWSLLGSEGTYLKSCCEHCGIRRPDYIDLALLSSYALLGPEEFRRFVRSPADANRIFLPLERTFGFQ